MSNFVIDQNKLVNKNTFTIKPLPKTDYGLQTKIYESRYKYSRNIIADNIHQIYNDTSLVSYNDTKSIRLTLTPKAIRLNKFNYYSNTFSFGYPENYVYSFCNPESASVFQYGSYQYSKKFITNNSHPNNISIETVYSSVQSNQYGKNFTGNINCCPNGLAPDPITGLCSTISLCVPDPGVPCPEPEYVNLTNTIYGYAYYFDTIRYVNIPNIGERLVRCAGGHVCDRTHFKPKLTLEDNTVIQPSNNISMDNWGEDSPIPQYAPVLFNAISPYERSDSFTFTVPDPSLLNSNCLVELECLSPVQCHNSVTMLFLVGQRSDNNEYVLLFANCIAPGEFNTKFLGSIPCNEYEPPIPCEPTTPPPPPPPPPPNCNYLSKTKAIVIFDKINIPLEAFGDQSIIDQLLLIIGIPKVIDLTNIDEFGFSADPHIAGSIMTSIQVLVYVSGVVNGPNSIEVSIGLNILQMSSAYPFIYCINIVHTVSINNLCDFNQQNGIVPTGGGVSAPFFTGDGNETANVEFI